MSDTQPIKKLLVLARRDADEAIRVAAGLTIHNHEVRLLFVSKPALETEQTHERLELLELSEIIPQTTIPALAGEMECLDSLKFSQTLEDADHVISL